MSLAFMHQLVARDLAGGRSRDRRRHPGRLPRPARRLPPVPDRRPRRRSGRPAVARPSHRADRARRRASVIGSAGFHAPPDRTAGSSRLPRRARLPSPGRRDRGRPGAVRLGARARGRPVPGVGLAGQRGLAGDHPGLGFQQVGVQIDDIDGEELVFDLDGWPPDRGARLPWLAMPDRSTDDTPDAFDTLAVHAGAEPDELTGAVSPPIYQTSTYAQDGVGRPRRGYEYARSQNPTRERLERAVAALEGGRARDRVRVGLGRDRGHRGARRRPATRSSSATTSTAARSATSSGSAAGAGSTPLRRPRVGPGRPVGGAHRPDAARLVRDAVEPAAQGHRHRGHRGDRRPARRRRAAGVRSSSSTTRSRHRRSSGRSTGGADIVFHSATKYLGRPLGHDPRRRGHLGSDAVAERLRFLQNAMGGVPGPLDCFLVLRGLRTLHLRMERHGANAAIVAEFLAAGPTSRRVSYPAFGGMVSFLPARRRPARSDRGGAGRRDRRGRPACSPWPSRSAASSR